MSETGSRGVQISRDRHKDIRLMKTSTGTLCAMRDQVAATPSYLEKAPVCAGGDWKLELAPDGGGLGHYLPMAGRRRLVITA